MGKIATYFKNPQIQIAFVSGACIIILALFYKKVMHEPVPSLPAAVPALIFVIAESAVVKKKGIWSKAWTWNTLAVLATAIIMVKRLL